MTTHTFDQGTLKGLTLNTSATEKVVTATLVGSVSCPLTTGPRHDHRVERTTHATVGRLWQREDEDVVDAHSGDDVAARTLAHCLLRDEAKGWNCA